MSKNPEEEIIHIESTALKKLFPEHNHLRDKAIEFLRVCFSCGWSFRGAARKLGIHHLTVKNILEELKFTDLYAKFLKEIKKEIQGFFDDRFVKTLFDRYEAEYNYLSKKIAEIDDDRLKKEYLRLKHQIMRDQLKAAFIAKSSKEIADSDLDKFDKSMDDVYNEALQEFGESIN